MSAFLSARPTKFLCLFLSLLMITLNLPDLSLACFTLGGGGLYGRQHSSDTCDFAGSNTIVEATGNLHFWSPIFTIPGRGQPLSIEFTYNSNNAGEKSPFGYGWMLNYDMYVTKEYFGMAEQHWGTEKVQTISYKEKEKATEPEMRSWGWGDSGGQAMSPGAYHPFTLRQADGGGRTYDLLSSSDGEAVYVPQTGAYETITHYTDPEEHYIRELKNGTQQRFDADGNLVLITDANGNSITITRDEDGYIQSVTDPSGLRTAAFTRPAGSSRITKVTGPDGTEYHLGYNSSGDLVSFSSFGWGAAVEMEYDNHRMTSRSDVYGETVLYTYDGEGRVETRTDREGKTRHYDYDAKKKVTTVTDPRGGSESLTITTTP